jgi:hypothetical protein
MATVNGSLQELGTSVGNTAKRHPIHRLRAEAWACGSFLVPWWRCNPEVALCKIVS